MTDPNSSSFSTFFPSSSPSNNNSTANREEIKKSYFQLKFLLKYSFHSLTNQDKKQFLILEEKLKELLLNIPSNHQLLSPQQHELILQRRKNLDLNIELKEIFSLFWLILSKDIQKKDKKGSGEEQQQQQQVASDGEEGASLVLSKFHYIQFHILLQLALIGNAIDENETKAIAEADYRYDTMLFGPINEVAFFDMMISLIEVWADMVSPKYHAAFAWALLASTVNMKLFPPKFYSKNQIKCITTVTSQQDILTKFSTEKSFRSNIQVKSEWLNAVNLRPEVQKRLSSRRVGHLVKDARPVFDMLKITEMNYHRQQSLASKAQDHISVGGSDSDDGSSVGSSYVGDLPYLESSKSTRTTFYPGKKGSPPSSPTNETMAITGKRTSMFEAKDRLQIKSPTTKNYLSPKNLPQSNLTYGRGSYRKSMRSSMISKSSEDQLAPPTSSLSSELQEWLNSVMNLNPSVGSNRSIDLSSERRTPDRPSSRGGGISLSSLGSSEVRLSTFTPKPLNNTFLSDDDDDPVEGTESTPSNNQLRSSPIQSEPTSPVLLYPDYQTENGSHSSLKYGVFGGSWDPKRAKIFKRRKQQPESIKLKITREVAKSRAKYKIPDYTSEAIRGKNPLIPPELREPVKGDDGVDIVELLSETMKKEKKLKKIPPASTTRATTPSRPLTSNPLGTLITGLSLTTPASLSTSHQQKITPPTLLTVQAQSPSQESVTNTLNPFFLTETSQQQVNEPKKSPKVLPTSSLPPSFHESQYYLDSSEKKLSTMTDTVTPEVYIVSKSHPSLTNIGSLPSLHVASSTSSHGKTSSQIIQPHAAYPFSTYGPWIPNGGMGVMISDKSDPLMSWEENRDVLKYCPYDNTEIRTVLKRQNIIRNSFEGYAKKQPNFTISTSSIPS